MPKVFVNGINIRYKVEGQGEPLVMIMGFSGDLTGWVFQRRAFRKHFTMITFDNRGVGKTDKPAGAYSMKMMADDTVGLMDHLGIEKAHVCGVSMGGMIAQEIAINYPERVGKLVLGCTAAGTINSPALTSVLGEGYTDEDVRSLPIMKFVNILVSHGFNKFLYRVFLVPMAKIYARFGSPVGLTGQLEAVLAHNTLDRLQAIGAPTLVITGAADRLIPSSSSDELANGIPNARLVKIEGASHSFFIEMRGRANKDILDFLKAG